VTTSTTLGDRRGGERVARGPARRLVCIVEGNGEVDTVPALCARVLHHLEIWSWIVLPVAIRQPRASLVQRGQPNALGLRRAVELARRRPADAALILCDSDDDCPAAWGPASERVLVDVLPVACVMVVREYEAWLLASRTRSQADGHRRIEQIRDAKKHFRAHWPGYMPSVDQLDATREIDIARLRKLAPSFDKLVRSLHALVSAD